MNKKIALPVGAGIAVLSFALLVWTGVSYSPNGVLGDARDYEVKSVVRDTISMYDSDKENAFESINSGAGLRIDSKYPFVLDPITATIVAHGSNPGIVGNPSKSLTDGDRPLNEILTDLENNDGTWVEYTFENPETGQEQLKRSWLYLHDGHIFGSGYYLP